MTEKFEQLQSEVARSLDWLKPLHARDALSTDPVVLEGLTLLEDSIQQLEHLQLTISDLALNQKDEVRFCQQFEHIMHQVLALDLGELVSSEELKVIQTDIKTRQLDSPAKELKPLNLSKDYLKMKIKQAESPEPVLIKEQKKLDMNYFKFNLKVGRIELQDDPRLPKSDDDVEFDDTPGRAHRYPGE